MRIAFLIGKLMMNAMRSHPENRSAFKRQGRARGQEIFHPLGSLVSAMREQPVVGHADAQASRNPPQKHRNEKGLPGEKEKGSNRPNMKQGHKGCSYPVDFVIGGWLAVQRFEFHG